MFILHLHPYWCTQCSPCAVQRAVIEAKCKEGEVERRRLENIRQQLCGRQYAYDHRGQLVLVSQIDPRKFPRPITPCVGQDESSGGPHFRKSTAVAAGGTPGAPDVGSASARGVPHLWSILFTVQTPGTDFRVETSQSILPCPYLYPTYNLSTRLCSCSRVFSVLFWVGDGRSASVLWGGVGCRFWRGQVRRGAADCSDCGGWSHVLRLFHRVELELWVVRQQILN